MIFGSEPLPGTLIVGDSYHNTNRSILVTAPEITLRPVGTRHVAALAGDAR